MLLCDLFVVLQDERLSQQIHTTALAVTIDSKTCSGARPQLSCLMQAVNHQRVQTFLEGYHANEID
jgi:hypothetical protein